MKACGRPLLFLLCALIGTQARAAAHRRALLVGIDDYSASHLSRSGEPNPVPDRDYPNLGGAVNDVRGMAEMLVHLYGFEPADVVTLTDQQATRAAILQALETHLLKPAAKGDVLLFYYSGHGSQVANSRSDEPDKLDESIVPSDSRLGAPDIRDKELRTRFNQILDHGARLTVILDSCHSGSGARGLATGARPRGIKPDPRDVAEASPPGPSPEDRGALIISAAEDFDLAWETRDEEGRLYGSFSLAWLRALRVAAAGEPVRDTFLRARARLRAETPYQEPVMAGNAEARLSPFLGVRTDRRGDRTVIAVEKVREDGTVVLQGGWANGLAVGCELRSLSGGATRLTVSAIRGLGTSEATVAAPAVPRWLHPGALLEVVGWAAPRGKPLRVWMPRSPMNVEALAALAPALSDRAKRHRVRWVSDPTAVTPAYLLRWRDRGWEILNAQGSAEHLGAAGALAAIGKTPPGSSLFVQLPAPAALLERIALRDGVECVERPEDAQYILVGRYAGRKLQYAWVRPAVKMSDRRNTGLPLRTAWHTIERGSDQTNDAAFLRDLALRLRRIYAWNLLESPPEARLPYHLTIRRSRDGEEIRDSAMIGGQQYGLVLRRDSAPPPAQVQARFVYAFAIDSFGRSVLLFPLRGSVENRLPLPPLPGQEGPYPPLEIPLGPPELFAVSRPYGIDSYFLLTTDEPLPDPWILEWDGVRTRTAIPATALEELLSINDRSESVVMPANWSIEKLLCESVPPRAAPVRGKAASQ